MQNKITGRPLMKICIFDPGEEDFVIQTVQSHLDPKDLSNETHRLVCQVDLYEDPKHAISLEKFIACIDDSFGEGTAEEYVLEFAYWSFDCASRDMEEGTTTDERTFHALMDIPENTEWDLYKDVHLHLTQEYDEETLMYIHNSLVEYFYKGLRVGAKHIEWRQDIHSEARSN